MPAVSTAEPCDTSQNPLAQYDPDRAREMIQEAGAEGLTFTLVGRGPSTPIAEVVQAQLAAVGLNPQIEVWDFAEGIQRIYGGFSADKPGEPVASFGFNSSKSAPIFGYQNWAANWMTGVSTLAANEEYRGLVAQANSMNSVLSARHCSSACAKWFTRMRATCPSSRKDTSSPIVRPGHSQDSTGRGRRRRLPPLRKRVRTVLEIRSSFVQWQLQRALSQWEDAT